jgi:hypothetical protein
VNRDRYRLDRVIAQTAYLSLFAIGALSVALGLTHSASAALIGVSLSYDGSVRSGATTGVEDHDLAPIFPPNPATVPVTNPSLPAPLLPARQLSASMTEFLDTFMSMFVQHVVITLQGQGGGTNNSFANPLDTTLLYPVKFDASFYSNNLPANQMLMLVGSGIEDGDDLPPIFPVPPVVMTSGVGTPVNPWRVQIGIPANLVTYTSNGFAKVHLYYKTAPLVPEPAACAMLLVGVACLCQTVARGRRR